MTAGRSGSLVNRGPSRLPWIIAALALLIGCAPLPRQAAPPTAVEAPTRPSSFTLQAGELETWNAVGQLLVRQEGVTYQGRSQKLGLYTVDYRGESFFVLTRALVASEEVRTLTTEVRVALHDGATNRSAVATELLAILQARLPAELLRIAALPKPEPAKTKAVVKKKRAVKRAAAK